MLPKADQLLYFEITDDLVCDQTGILESYSADGNISLSFL
jgi:hypothetical protein